MNQRMEVHTWEVKSNLTASGQEQLCTACTLEKASIKRLTAQTKEEQSVINNLIEQNHRLAVRLNHYESKPKWWQLRAMLEWRGTKVQ